MKHNVLYAYDKARKVIDSMYLIQSGDIDEMLSIVCNTFRYLELFREMYGVDNFYYKALLEYYFKKRHEVTMLGAWYTQKQTIK